MNRPVILVLIILAIVFMLFRQPANDEFPYTVEMEAKTDFTSRDLSDWQEKEVARESVRDIFSVPAAYVAKADLEKPDVSKQVVVPIRPVLSGIFSGDGRNFAVINGEIYRVGEIYQGREIVSIEKKRVLFDNSDTLEME